MGIALDADEGVKLRVMANEFIARASAARLNQDSLFSVDAASVAPARAALAQGMTDEQIDHLKRGGHDDDIAAWNRLATRNTRPANLFNHCGISLPIQHLGAALPVGLQLCTHGGDDALLLGVAVAVEALLG